MRALGRHMLIEYHHCDGGLLSKKGFVRTAMIEAARRGKATIVADVFHHFSPQGVSGVVVVAESHLAIHTWPEHRYAAVDVFSCGTKLKRTVMRNFLKKAFRAGRVTSVDLKRGMVG